MKALNILAVFVILVFTTTKVNSNCLDSLTSMSKMLTETLGRLQETRNELNKVRSELEAEKNKSRDQSTMQPTTAIPQSVSEYECAFENISACGYNQTSNDEVTWLIGQGQVSQKTGPKADHTLGTPGGHYLYIDGIAEAKKKSHMFDFIEETKVEFPPIVPSNNTEFCISFWYSMFGKDVHSLKFYVRGDDINSRMPVFTKDGNQGPGWKLFQYELPKAKAEFSFEFTATTRAYVENSYDENKQILHNTECNIAIDDIKVVASPCIYPIPVSTVSAIIG